MKVSRVGVFPPTVVKSIDDLTDLVCDDGASSLAAFTGVLVRFDELVPLRPLFFWEGGLELIRLWRGGR